MSAGWLNTKVATVANVGPWSTTFVAGKIEPARGYLEVPGFTLTNLEPLAHARRAAQYNYAADKAFSFENWPNVSLSDDWFICLAWRRGDWKARFKCWDVENCGFLLYEQDIIHRYFSVEFWCRGVTTITVPSFKLYTSQRYDNPRLIRSLETNVAIPATLCSSELQISWGAGTIPWGEVFSTNGRWLDNEGTWNEMSAGSDRRASELFPVSWM